MRLNRIIGGCLAIALAACSAPTPPAATAAAPSQIRQPEVTPTKANGHAFTRTQALANCKKYSSMATELMKARQSGVALADVMAATQGDPDIQGIVMTAYEQPRMRLEENQQRVIVDFANEVYLACAKGSGIGQ